MSKDSITFPKLNETNYTAWAASMEAYLKSQRVWRITAGTSTRPTGTDAAAIALQNAWDDKCDQASGYLFLGLEDSMKVHVRDHTDDPVVMWVVLNTVGVIKVSSSMFNLYQELFNYTGDESKPLTAISSDVTAIFAKIKDLRAASYTLEMMDKELAALVMIRALPRPKHAMFFSDLLRREKLDDSIVVTAFARKDQEPASSSAPVIATAMLAAPGLCTVSDCAFAAVRHFSHASDTIICSFCSGKGHKEADCHRRQAAQSKAQLEVAEKRKKGAKGAKTGAKAAEAGVLDSNDEEEQAGAHASALFVSDPSTPFVNDAGADINPDTGATAHMMPHRHWFHQYTPRKVPIRLADNSVVYSAGIGTVHFHPLLDGKKAPHVVQFSRVCTSLLCVAISSLSSILLAQNHFVLS